MDNIFSRNGIIKFPVSGGIAAFIENMVMGVKIIMRSAKLCRLDDETEEDGNRQRVKNFWRINSGDKLADYSIYFSVAVSLLIFYSFVFMLLPEFCRQPFKTACQGRWAL